MIPVAEDTIFKSIVVDKFVGNGRVLFLTPKYKAIGKLSLEETLLIYIVDPFEVDNVDMIALDGFVLKRRMGNVFYNSKGEFIYVTLDKLIAIEENKVCLLNFHKVAQ
ncbi:hypothetical protein ACIQVU_07845 [Lysinibacillus sp. NPDC098008]|uniref:hypothetical protein n=1 Tax=Lysinibacillus sp. NPDC098008 TaxID=3364146 RepID=UPI00381A94B1